MFLIGLFIWCFVTFLIIVLEDLLLDTFDFKAFSSVTISCSIVLYIIISVLFQNSIISCEYVSEIKNPNKIIRDLNNNCFIIDDKLNKRKPSIKLTKDKESYIEIRKYKQTNKLLDYMLFDFEREILYLNPNDKIETVYYTLD